jgi:hypothetical protein
VETIRSAEDFGAYHILHAVTESDVQSITAVADHLDYQLDYVEDRCDSLEKQDALQVAEGGEIVVTETGYKYIEGEQSLTD